MGELCRPAHRKCGPRGDDDDIGDAAIVERAQDNAAEACVCVGGGEEDSAGRRFARQQVQADGGDRRLERNAARVHHLEQTRERVLLGRPERRRFAATETKHEESRTAPRRSDHSREAKPASCRHQRRSERKRVIEERSESFTSAPGRESAAV